MLLGIGILAPGIARGGDAKFLLVSDFHLNPMADATLVDELVKADPAQWEAILNRTSPTGYSQYKSDTNWWLLKSALRQFPKTIRHPAFVMVTGDLLAHDYPQLFQSATHDADQQHYRAFVRKTVEFLALELKRKFPEAKIYFTPGNNDNDCGDYTIQANGAFLDDTAAVVQRMADGDATMAGDWKALGSFVVAHPTIAGVRIVSLNSIFWSQKYQALNSEQGCKPVASTAPADMMHWLEQELAAAAQKNQKVWLMFHIPPGIDGYASAMKRKKQIAAGVASATDRNNPPSQNQAGWGASTEAACSQAIVPMWATQWTAQFDALLAKYTDIVAAVFAAHTHSDDFRVVGQQSVLMNPAISPVYSQNPGFRVVTYGKDARLRDQSTYYLVNLPVATAKNRGRWKREYTFTRQWKVRELNAASLNRVYGQVVADDTVQKNWLKLYAVSGPAEEGEKSIARALYCAVEGLSVESFKDCYCGAETK